MKTTRLLLASSAFFLSLASCDKQRPPSAGGSAAEGADQLAAERALIEEQRMALERERLEEERAALEEEKDALRADREARLAAREQDLESADLTLEERQRQLAEREAELSGREDDLASRESILSDQEIEDLATDFEALRRPGRPKRGAKPSASVELYLTDPHLGSEEH
jgi:hypothetical protein